MPKDIATTAPLRRVPRVPVLAKEPRPIKVPKPVIAPRGPAIYKLGAAPQEVSGGPGEPPTGFVTAQTSAEEWVYYWAIAKVLGDPKNPRQAPYTGGRDWDYQSDDPIFGGRIAGGAVLDYVVRLAGETVGIRLQTERWHVMAGATQQAKDFYSFIHLRSTTRVMDVFTQYGIADASGRAACEQIARALRGDREADPLRLGTARQVRP